MSTILHAETVKFTPHENRVRPYVTKPSSTAQGLIRHCEPGKFHNFAIFTTVQLETLQVRTVEQAVPHKLGLIKQHYRHVQQESLIRQ